MRTIWTNAYLPEPALTRLQEGTCEHRLLIEPDAAPNLGVGAQTPLLAEAEIAFGQPDPEQLLALPNVRWVHITSAGYTRYDREDLRKAFQSADRIFTNSSSVFDEPCAQHVLAFMLANTRQLPTCFEHQITDRGWRTEELRRRSSLLRNQHVLLVGYGAIAHRLAQLLAPFQVEIKALRRTIRGDESVATYPIDALAELLPWADHIVDVLPANPSTDGLFNAIAFGLAKPGAVFYNIGRGTTVDQAALIEALESGRLGAAYLDVTTPEPLPATDPLWKAPNCIITPHSAGGHADEFERQVAHFLQNLALYDRGEPLTDRVF
jgi:phosphoglycerate dehydrogenase-like enzyme